MSKPKLTDEQILGRKFTCDKNRRKTTKQHTTPCAGCPWLRKSIAGYLGSMTPEEWIQEVHGESYIDCHNTTNQQCAGAAIYRDNVFKSVKDPRALRLPGNTDTVFETPMEFLAHHKQTQKG
jgi:hypothetical protein